MKAALRRAAVSADDECRTSAEELEPASALLREVVQGLWSLVDCFVENGRRYLIVRPEHGAADHLSVRAYQILARASLGHSNKQIAYDLALPVSTVATDLARAMRKVGIRSRVELVGLSSIMSRGSTK